jgi:phosphoserine aminotransferase
MECALAASLCTMVLAQYPGFGPAGLQAVFALILMNLERCQRVRILYQLQFSNKSLEKITDCKTVNCVAWTRVHLERSL